MSYEPCLCGSPDCWQCGPAQGWHVHTRDCADEDGVYACGQRTYDDPEPEPMRLCASCDREESEAIEITLYAGSPVCVDCLHYYFAEEEPACKEPYDGLSLS